MRQSSPRSSGIRALVFLALSSAIGVSAYSASPAYAAERGGSAGWTLTTADFQTQTVALVSLNDTTAVVMPVGGGKKREVAIDQVLELAHAVPTPWTQGLRLNTVGGDHYLGTPEQKAMEGDVLHWHMAGVGLVSVPLANVESINRDGRPPAATADAKRTQDRVTLQNGDEVAGIVTGLDAETITLQNDAGQSVSVPVATMQSLVLATTGAAPRQAGERAFRVALADGSSVSCSKITYAPAGEVGGEAAFTATPVAADEPVKLRLGQVVSIEQVNGPVVWLAGRTPTASEQTPFLDIQFPPRMNRTVQGKPIVFAGQSYPHGIGVHSRTVITWPIEDGDKRFRTRFAIDGPLPYANVTVRVLLDGKPAFEKQDVTAGDMSDVVEIDLKQAKTITLEVDYGKGYDVQDRLNWIEPAILR